MEQIFENLKDVGLATTVISLITIFLIGCVKLIPAVKNMNTNLRKALYQALNIVFGGILSVLYTLFIAKGGWEINALYPLYENLGLRELWKKILSLIFKKKDTKVVEGATNASSTTEEDKKETFSDSEWLE